MESKRSIDSIFLQFLKDNSTIIQKKYAGLTLQAMKFAFEDYCALKNFLYDERESVEGVNLNHKVISRFLKYIKAGVPLAYISNTAHFLDLNLYVNQNVLIPRPETELLVDEAVKLIESKDLKRVVEIGTGSGCIILGITSMCRTPLVCDAIDISEEALEVAKINFFRHRYRIHPDTNINFVLGDRFKNLNSEEYELIVSNPPYIKTSERNTLVHEQVTDYEPHVALFVEDNEYSQWFEIFFNEAFRVLRSDGRLLLEGSEKHLNELSDIAKRVGFQNVIVKKDLTQSDRFLLATK